MQSPKFPKKSAELKLIVSASILRAVWKKSVREQLRRQIIPDPVEHLDFHTQINLRVQQIEGEIVSGNFSINKVVRLKFEKSKGLCRQVVLPAPEDALVLQVLSNALWKLIKPKAPSRNAFYAPQDQPFSKKSKSDDDENDWGYGPFSVWLNFQKRILKFSKKKKYIVVTDVANYYDNIIHGFLRSILAEYTQEKEYALDFILYIIDSMLWRPDYMPNYGIGMPQMNLDAPRLLAHTHLFEIDELFEDDQAVEFARYMDDMDFGVDTIAKAKQVLRDLDLALQTRNLRLNSGKTKILTAADAERFFCVKENMEFEWIEKKLTGAQPHSVRKRLWSAALAKKIDNIWSSNAYEYGNGTKVLKRLIFLASRNQIPLTDRSFSGFFFEIPALREAVLFNLSRVVQLPLRLSILSDFLESGESVDDVSKIMISDAVTQSHCQNAIDVKELGRLLNSLDRYDAIGLYCRIWLISRFGSTKDLRREVDNSGHIWSRHRFLIRLVAGLSGIFRTTTHFAAFQVFARKWGGSEAEAMLNFHENIASSVDGYESVMPFLEADNPSLPNGISHAKSLMLASAICNEKISKIKRAKLLGKKSKMMSDVYYRDRFSQIISSVN